MNEDVDVILGKCDRCGMELTEDTLGGQGSYGEYIHMFCDPCDDVIRKRYDAREALPYGDDGLGYERWWDSFTDELTREESELEFEAWLESERTRLGRQLFS